MSLVIPDPRWENPAMLIPGRKPVGPVVINRALAVTHGLTDFILMNHSPEEFIDLVGNPRGPVVVGTTTRPENGWLLDQTNADASISGLSMAAATISNSQYTVAVVITPGSDGWLWARYAGGDQKQLFFTETGFRSRQDTTGGTNILNFGDHSARCVIVTVDTDSGFHRCYQDGHLAAETSITGTIKTTDFWFYIGNNETSSGVLDAIYQSLIAWDRALTVAEACEISRNPYSFLIPA